MAFGESLGKIAAVAAIAFAASACSGTMGNPSNPDKKSSKSAERKIVTPGKADNYYSNVAKEYELSGSIDVEMSEETFEDETERNKRISQRLSAVGLYLTTYLTAKFRGIDSDNSGEIEDDEVFFENTDYGGFQAMVRNYSVETEDVESATDGEYTVDYTIDVAGPKQFPRMLIEDGGERTDGGVRFGFRMPAGATSDPENVSRGVIRDFDPSNYDGELEEVTLTANPLPKISDAYPHYDAFMEDGVYDITLFYGHDYNESRSDLKGAREALNLLQREGFEGDADSFDELDNDTGAFTKTVRVPGREGSEEVELQVRIFHSNMFEGERDLQHDLAIEELQKRDVFFYNGHAGPYYGFYLDGNHEASVDYRKLAEIDLQQKQQLFIAQGCQTYSQYADMLYANPAKSEENLDAITTVNYSYGEGTMQLFENLISMDREGRHQPVSFYDIVEDLNNSFLNSYKDVFYGVMGIDGNPQVHPYGNVEALGQSCETDADCGGGSANLCVEQTCAVRALAEGSCPSGSSFGYLGSGDRTVDGGICY